MERIRADKNLIKAMLAVVTLVLLYFFSFEKAAFLKILSLKTSDIFVRTNYELKQKPKELGDICIIALDDESFAQMNKKWPWPRSVSAEFLTALLEYKPKTVSLDITFVGESTDKKDDISLEKAFKNLGNVILAAYITPEGKYSKPYNPFLDSIEGFGFINKPRDRDAISRDSRVLFPHRVSNKPISYYSGFGINTVFSYLNVDKKSIRLQDNNLYYVFKNPKFNAQLEERLIPLTQRLTIPINYQARKKDFTVVSFYKVLRKEAKKEDISGRIVVVGATSEIFHDIYRTPIGIMPGVYLNANEMLMYLTQNFIKPIPRGLVLFFLLLLGILSCVLTYKLKVIHGLIALLIELIAIGAMSIILSYKNFSYDYFGPFFIVALAYIGTEAFKYLRLIVEATILKTLAITDGLTGLYVHRYLMLKLESEFNRAKEENSQLSFLIMDIDHFKNINDTYGHEEGNVILKQIAKILKDTSRKVDIVARYGGEEFCVILPSTPEKGAFVYADRLRKVIEDFDFPYKEDQTLRATISIGVTSLKTSNPQTPQDIIAFADKALYEAKETGRNKVCVYVAPVSEQKNNP